MKKLTAALLSIALLGAFAACGITINPPPAPGDAPEETSAASATTELTLQFTINIPTTTKKQVIPGDITEYLSCPVEQLVDAVGCEYRNTTDYGLKQYSNNSDKSLATIDITDAGDSIEIECTEPGFSIYGIAVGELFTIDNVPADYRAMPSLVPGELHMFTRGSAFSDTLLFAVDEQGIVLSFQMQILR